MCVLDSLMMSGKISSLFATSSMDRTRNSYFGVVIMEVTIPVKE